MTILWLVGPVLMVLGVPCMGVQSAPSSKVFHFLFEALKCCCVESKINMEYGCSYRKIKGLEDESTWQQFA